MTVLDQLVTTVRAAPSWATMIPHQTTTTDSPTCTEWGRKGGSHYKDGQFTKK
jgi:hypothetical protein